MIDGYQLTPYKNVVLKTNTVYNFEHDVSVKIINEDFKCMVGKF